MGVQLYNNLRSKLKNVQLFIRKLKSFLLQHDQPGKGMFVYIFLSWKV